MNWAILHSHDWHSLQDSISNPELVAKRVAELGISACAITNHGNLGSVVAHYTQCRQNKVKPILGCELYLSQQSALLKSADNRSLSHLVVLAKNKEGWKSLLRATARSNRKDVFYYRPRLDLDILGEYTGNLISFSGHPGSDLANILFTDLKGAYGAKTFDEVKPFIDSDYLYKAINLANRYQDIFGKGNFFLEVQLIDKNRMPVAEFIASVMRTVSSITNIQCVATSDAHYVKKEDVELQRIALCSGLQTTLGEVKRKLTNQEDVGLGSFFVSDKYYIPSTQEIVELHKDHLDEVDNAGLIASLCEDYDILSKPKISQFPTPNGQSSDDYLHEVCREGWVKKIQNKVHSDKLNEYQKRIKHELDVIKSTGILADYMLVVLDYINAAKSRGELVSPGRGSSAGSLACYLSNITDIDPIEYGLIFERFYNAGRNTGDRVALMDIDTDFPKLHRQKTIEYVRNKYGANKVAQMATYTRMMGPSAMKAVLRAHNACSFDEMNRITEFIPDEAAISDELQEMRDEGELASVIKWALQHEGKHLSEWCELKDDGTLDGPFSYYFDQAIRLEGCKTGASKHASGVVISSENLDDYMPMIHDKSSDELICGVPMQDVELLGGIKYDILGTLCLDKLMGFQTLMRGEKIRLE